MFRFAFIYWIGIVLVLCAAEDTGVSAFGKVVGPIWNPIVVWIGKHVLGIAYEVHPGVNGSVDKTTDWIGVLVAVVAAAVGSTVWALLDHRRRHDDQLRSLLELHARLEPLLTQPAMFAYDLIVLIDREVTGDPALAPDAVTRGMVRSAREIASLLRKSWSIPTDAPDTRMRDHRAVRNPRGLAPLRFVGPPR